MQALRAVLVVAAALASLQRASAGVEDLVDDNSLDNDLHIYEPAPKKAPPFRKYVNIVEYPESMRHVVGQTSTMTCAAAGWPMPEIRWLKNGMPMEDAYETNELPRSEDANIAVVVATLQIYTMSHNVEDVYTCVASNGLMTTEASARVMDEIDAPPAMFKSVNAFNRHMEQSPRAPIVTQYARSVLGTIMDTVALPCRVAGNPKPQVTWRRGDVNVPLDPERIKVSDSGELVFSPLLWADMGIYNCTASNEFGEATATTFVYPMAREQDKRRRQRSRH